MLWICVCEWLSFLLLNVYLINRNTISWTPLLLSVFYILKDMPVSLENLLIKLIVFSALVLLFYICTSVMKKYWNWKRVRFKINLEAVMHLSIILKGCSKHLNIHLLLRMLQKSNLYQRRQLWSVIWSITSEIKESGKHK